MHTLLKKITLVTLLLCCSLSFSGCGIVSNMISNFQTKVEDKKSQESLNDAKRYRMSEDSMEAVENAQAKIDAYTDAVDDYNEAGPFSKLWKTITNSKGKARSEMKSAEKKASRALRDDKTYQDSLEQEKAVKEKQFKEYIPIILAVLGVVALTLIIVLILACKPKKPASAPIVKPETSEVRASIGDANTTGDVAVNYEKLLKSNCKKLGLDYKEQLDKYGDARTAAEQTQLML